MKKIILTFIIIILILFFSIVYIVKNNNKYINKEYQELKHNYELNEKIEYLTKSNYHYIILTKTSLILLDKEYQEIQIIETNKLFKIQEEHQIVYRLNKIMYETKKIEKTKITYKYYDIYDGQLLDTLVVGG